MYFFLNLQIKFTMKRIKLKHHKRLKKFDYILMVIFLIIISVILAFYYIGKHATPIIQDYAEKQAKRISAIVISQAVNDEVVEYINVEDMFVETQNSSGEVSSVDFNSAAINQVLSKVSKSVKAYLKKIENGEIEDLNLSDTSVFNVSPKDLKNGIIYEVPTGIIFNNGLLANIGPKIPIKLSLIGEITTDIETNITDYGINNAVIQVSVKVTVSEQVIFPYDSSLIEVETIIPIAMKLIQGNIPEYYFNGSGIPSLSIDSN